MNLSSLLAFGSRLLLFFVLWVVLSGLVWRDPVLAALAIGSATATSLYLWPAGSLQLAWLRLPPLAAFFLWSSLKGGVDIGWRALSPSMPLQPGFMEFECHLSTRRSLIFFTWLISLMPGTASVNLHQQTVITVHVVDTERYGDKDLRRLEKLVASFLRSEGAPP
jgi:multicomponent Na+:H+ antiporter subunit E